MIKFLLGFVALIVVLLATYMFTSKPTKTPKTTTVTKVEKKDVSEKEAEVSEVKEEKTHKRVISVAKSPKVVSTESANEMGNQEELGKGLTLESIENADVSDKEKEQMRHDLVYYQGIHMEPTNPLGDDEIEEMIEEDMKNGLIPEN